VHALAACHTAEAARGRHVLAIQDTTELNFSAHTGSKRGFGVVGNGRDIGLFLHPVIVVDAGDGDPRQVGHAGGILGLADANIYSRKKAPPGGRKSRERQRKVPRPIEAKESGRWIRPGPTGAGGCPRLGNVRAPISTFQRLAAHFPGDRNFQA